MRDVRDFNRMFREAEKDLSVLETRENQNLILRFTYLSISTRSVYQMRSYEQQHDMKTEVAMNMIKEIKRVVNLGIEVRSPNKYFTTVNGFRLGVIARDWAILKPNKFLLLDNDDGGSSCEQDDIPTYDGDYNYDVITEREDFVSECNTLLAISKGSLHRGQKLDLIFKVASQMNVEILK